MSHKNGCHNRAPLREEIRMQDGWSRYGGDAYRVAAMRTYPVPMTKECQYTKTELGKVDAGCDGCKWGLK